MLAHLKSDVILHIAERFRIQIVQARSSIARTRCIASWSSVMVVYLLDRVYELLLHNWCMCASEFLSAVLTVIAREQCIFLSVLSGRV